MRTIILSAIVPTEELEKNGLIAKLIEGEHGEPRNPRELGRVLGESDLRVLQGQRSIVKNSSAWKWLANQFGLRLGEDISVNELGVSMELVTLSNNEWVGGERYALVFKVERAPPPFSGLVCFGRDDEDPFTGPHPPKRFL